MELYIAILVFAVSSTVTPGPNNIMILTSGLNFGIRRSMPHLLGICIGFPLMVAAVGLGFGSLFESFPVLHEIIKVLGVTYLLYLAFAVATSAPSSLDADSDKKPFSFLQAAAFQWVNPKAWVMATGAVAAYTTQDAGMLMQVAFISLAFFIAAFPCVGIWLLGGSAMKRLFTQPSYQRAFNMLMALLLVISIAPVVLELFETYL